jgi:hypothetical protein
VRPRLAFEIADEPNFIGPSASDYDETGQADLCIDTSRIEMGA